MGDSFVYLDTGEIFAADEDGPDTGVLIALMGNVLEPEESDRIGTLFASAPALLEALEALQREFFPTPHPDDYAEWIAARAAINSARGSVG